MLQGCELVSGDRSGTFLSQGQGGGEGGEERVIRERARGWGRVIRERKRGSE